MFKMQNYKLLALVLLLKGVVAIEDNSISKTYGLNVDNPGVSCDDIYEKNLESHGKSGPYLIKTDKLFLTQCDMEFEKGWMQVADLDVSRGDDCPKEWSKITVDGVKACRSPGDSRGCYSKHFPVNGTKYRKVRGFVRGYQKGSVDAFLSGGIINDIYVDGVSVTLGNPRRHIWTYVAGLSDDGNSHTGANCPCAAAPGRAPPPFVGDHYYCESGNTGNFDLSTHYMKDPLWDGAGCGSKNHCCTAVGLPWFLREFPTMQNEDIEVRICASSAYADEAVLVDQIKLLVQ